MEILLNKPTGHDKWGRRLNPVPQPEAFGGNGENGKGQAEKKEGCKKDESVSAIVTALLVIGEYLNLDEHFGLNNPQEDLPEGI